MRIDAHILTGACVKQIRCLKPSFLMENIDTIVLHATEGCNAMSSAQYLARKDTPVSAHLVIARSGAVIQILPFHVRACHAGQSEHEGRKNFNNFSIGIELDNAGRLHRRATDFFRVLTGSIPLTRYLRQQNRATRLITTAIRKPKRNARQRSARYSKNIICSDIW